MREIYLSDRELSKVRTYFYRYVADDGWNPPEEVISEMEIKFYKTISERKKYLDQQHRLHKGDWITMDIMKDYAKRGSVWYRVYAGQYIKELRKLGNELIEKYGVTEIQAINIVSGQRKLFEDYFRIYESIRTRDVGRIDTFGIYNDIKGNYIDRTYAV